MGFVDAHTQIWTADTKRYPLAKNAVPRKNYQKDFSPEILLRHARPSKVDRIVLVQALIYGKDNSYILDVMHRFPKIFRSVAIVDKNTSSIVDEMSHLHELGVSGFRVTSPENNCRGWLNQPYYEKMFSHAASTKQAICVSTNSSGLCELDRMCSVHPETIVVIDHMAKIGESEKIQDTQVKALCSLEKHPNIYIKISRFHSFGKRKPPHQDLIPTINHVIDAFGTDRVMWGSDSPFQVIHETYEDSISVVRDLLNLSDKDQNLILGGTADKIFFAR